MTDKGAHLTLSERQIIETGISKGASKKSIADTIGKDKSTIGKEIKNHRILKRYYAYPIDCVKYPKCNDKNTYLCNKECSNYPKFNVQEEIEPLVLVMVVRNIKTVDMINIITTH